MSRRPSTGPRARVVPPLRLVLAHDGSPGAALAERLIAHGAWPAGTQVLLLSALGDVATRLATWATPAEAIAIHGAARAALDAVHEDATRRLTRRGLAVATRVSGGRPADVVIEAERELRPDALVVGSRGLGPIDTLLLGSTGMEVLVRSRSTVLVARREAVRRAVLAVDGSTASRRAERLVAAWPLFRDAEVLVVAVHRGGEPGADVARGLVGAAARRLVRAGHRVTTAVREGDPAGGILAEASAFGADLVALGARGTGGPSRGGIGSVARNVATAGPSVVVVRRAPAGDD